jgi:hypothetical protein
MRRRVGRLDRRLRGFRRIAGGVHRGSLGAGRIVLIDERDDDGGGEVRRDRARGRVHRRQDDHDHARRGVVARRPRKDDALQPLEAAGERRAAQAAGGRGPAPRPGGGRRPQHDGARAE